MKFRHNGYFFLLGVLNVVSVILLSTALGTSKWTEAAIVRKVATSYDNATLFDAGFKYLGLFRGCEQKKYGHYFQARSRCFNALDEFRAIARTDLVYVSLVSSCICIGILVVSIYLSFYNELVRSTSGLLQTRMPLVVFTLIVFLDALSFGSYLYLYVHYLRISLLSKTDIQDGFSTADRTKLAYSFWLVVASMGSSVLSLLILVVGALRKGKTKLTFGSKNKNGQVMEMKHKDTDGPVMMMY